MQPKDKIFAGKDEVKVAIVQTSPIYLNKEKSLEVACKKIVEAGKAGADLIVFSETWLAGYPYWDEGWNSSAKSFDEAREMWFDNSVLIPSEDTERLGAAAKEADAYLVIGCNELDPHPGVQTIYNTLLFIDYQGRVMGRHRKMVATYIEKVFWGHGDGSDLHVYETDIGRLGALICGEHNMTLARYRMIEQGEDIHVSVYPGCFSFSKGPRMEELDDGNDFMGTILSRAHALESGAFVLTACSYLDPATIAADFPFQDTLNVEYADGGSHIIAPNGSYIVPPTFGDTILYATCKASGIKLRKAIVDTIGNYSRFDILRLDYRNDPLQERFPTKELMTKKFVEAMETLPRQTIQRISDQHEVSIEAIEAIAEELSAIFRD